MCLNAFEIDSYAYEVFFCSLLFLKMAHPLRGYSFFSSIYGGVVKDFFSGENVNLVPPSGPFPLNNHQ